MMCGLGAEGARMLMDRIRNEYMRGTAQVEQTGYKVICACAEEGIAQVKDGARREEEKKGAGKGMSKVWECDRAQI